MTQNPNTGLNKVKYKLKGGTHFCLVKTKLVVFQGSILVFFLFLFHCVSCQLHMEKF